jgi:hypothetical protein
MGGPLGSAGVSVLACWDDNATEEAYWQGRFVMVASTFDGTGECFVRGF